MKVNYSIFTFPLNPPLAKGDLSLRSNITNCYVQLLYWATKITFLFRFTIATRKIFRIVNLKVVVRRILRDSYARVVVLNLE